MLFDRQTGFSRGRSGGLLFPSLEEFRTVCCDPHKDFGIVNEEVGVFLEFSAFFVQFNGCWQFGSSAFSESIFSIWKFSVPVLLKPSLENFERYFASV